MSSFRICRLDSKCDGLSHSAIKKRLIGLNALVGCVRCNKEYKKGSMELDHTIPICMGGEQKDETNIQLLCHSCHTKKTAIDKRISHIAVKIGIISRLSPWERRVWLKDAEELRQFYLYTKRLMDRAEQMKEEEGWLRW